MPGKCCVPACSSKEGTPGVHLFRFPKDTEKCKIWIKNCKLDELKDISAENLYKNYRICDLHFDKKFLAGICNQKLKYDAVPTIINPNDTQNMETFSSDTTKEYESDVILMETQPIIDDTNHDHLYVKFETEPETVHIAQEIEFVDTNHVMLVEQHNSNSPNPELDLTKVDSQGKKPIPVIKKTRKTKIVPKSDNVTQLKQISTIPAIFNEKNEMVFIAVSAVGEMGKGATIPVQNPQILTNVPTLPVQQSQILSNVKTSPVQNPQILSNVTPLPVQNPQYIMNIASQPAGKPKTQLAGLQSKLQSKMDENSWDNYENFIKMCDKYLPPHHSKIAKIQALFYKKRKEN